jgi:hypothetical protein
LDEGNVVNWAHGLLLRVHGVAAALTSSTEAAASSAVPTAALPTSGLLDGYEEYSKANWNGYGADPISSETIEATRQLLAVLPNTLGIPHISPGSDGTIGLEWVFADRHLRKLFIDVGPGKIWSGYWRRVSGETRTMPPRPIDVRTKTELGKLFSELST